MAGEDLGPVYDLSKNINFRYTVVVIFIKFSRSWNTIPSIKCYTNPFCIISINEVKVESLGTLRKGRNALLKDE